jgi:hypothetical protein
MTENQKSAAVCIPLGICATGASLWLIHNQAFDLTQVWKLWIVGGIGMVLIVLGIWSWYHEEEDFSLGLYEQRPPRYQPREDLERDPNSMTMEAEDAQ